MLRTVSKKLPNKQSKEETVTKNMKNYGMQ